MTTKPSANGVIHRAKPARKRDASALSIRGRCARCSRQGATRSDPRNRATATTATRVNSSDQRVSSTSSLRMFWTVFRPVSGRNRPSASRPANPAFFPARATATREVLGGASAGMSHLLDFRPAENALGQEDQGDRENGKRGDILVINAEIGGPHVVLRGRH